MILFFDTETTGFPDWKLPLSHEKQPHIVQLAAQLCDEYGRMLAEMCVVIDNDVDIPEKASAVHGITRERAAEIGIPADVALGEFAAEAERARANAIAKLKAAQKTADDRAEAAVKRAAEEAIAAERRRADEAAAEAKRVADAEIARLAAEKLKLERAESARIAETQRLADEEAARAKDRKHRADVMTAAKLALMRIGNIGEDAATAIVKALVNGKIPNVSVNF